MIDFSNCTITNVILHDIGNKNANDSIHLSKHELKIDQRLQSILKEFFLSAFKADEYFNLYHDSDLALNEVFVYVSDIFTKRENLYDRSVNLARHLYDKSTHPKIKAGEFYVAYFKDCLIEGEAVDAVGLFKSENKDTYLKVLQKEENFEIDYEEGININKLDKGCLVFNTEREKGYLVAIVDNVNKGYEAQYWKDDFLHVKARNDDYHHTQNVLSLCKNFVVDKLPEEFEISRADQADLLNKSVNFFKENESFNMDDFTQEVIRQPEMIKTFNDYRKAYADERQLIIVDEFGISNQALKKQQRIFKSVIKLDKNFHIYVHGNRELIEKGYDEVTGMNYYKVYFKEEA
jgi:hypothetical protein